MDGFNPIAAEHDEETKRDGLPPAKNYEAEEGDLTQFQVNAAFWRRSYRALSMGLGTPMSEPFTWFLIFCNIACQVAAGYVAQSHFYYTGTGTGSSDPGMAGCLKEKPAPCPTSTYETYFNKFAWTFFLVVGGVVGFSVIGDVINVRARRRISQLVQRRLLRGKALYEMQVCGDRSCRVDNFDQRLTADLQALLDGVCCALFGNSSDYLAYPIFFGICRICFSFWNTLHPPGNNPSVPGNAQVKIVFGVLAMTAVTFLAYILPVNQIARLFYSQQQSEGKFRATHASAITYSEQISFFSGELRERFHANEKFFHLYRTMQKYYAWQTGLMFLRILASISQPSVSYMMLALSEMTGTSNSSLAAAFLKQCGDVLEYLLYLPAIMARLGFAAGASHGVGQLFEALDQIEAITSAKAGASAAPTAGSSSCSSSSSSSSSSSAPEVKCETKCAPSEALHESVQSEEQAIVFENVIAGPPCSETVLFNNLTFRFLPGDSVVIVGESGCGKSSLLRVIAGLWPIKSGKVSRPAPAVRNTKALLASIANAATAEDRAIAEAAASKGIFFLPQRSYVFPGLLLAQVIYPETVAPRHTPELEAQIKRALEVMDACELSELARHPRHGLYAARDRLGVGGFEEEEDGNDDHEADPELDVDWGIVISSSERQRLSFARCLYHAPKFLLADEASSTMDMRTESVILQRCVDRGITMISVAHRPSVVPFHKKILRCTFVDGNRANRKWTVIDVPQEAQLDRYQLSPAEQRAIQEADKSRVPYQPPVVKPVTPHPSSQNHPTDQGVEMQPVKPEEKKQTTDQKPSLAVEEEEDEATFQRKNVFAHLWDGFQLTLTEKEKSSCCETMKSKPAIMIMLMALFMGIHAAVQIIIFKTQKTDDIINNVLLGNTQSAFNMGGNHVAINVVSAFMQTFSAACGTLLALWFQLAMVKKIHSQYFTHKVLYTLNKVEGVEGVDQIIVSDLGGLRESLAWVVGNPFAYLNYRLGAFPLFVSFIIMMIYAFTLAWQLCLFFLASLFAALLAQMFAARFSSQSLTNRQRAEGDYRTHLERVRVAVESITFFGGQAIELEKAERYLDRTIAARMQYVFNLGLAVIPTVAMYYWLSNGEYVMSGIIQTYWGKPLASGDIYTTLSFCVLLGKTGQLIVQSVGNFGMVGGYMNRVMDLKLQVIRTNKLMRTVLTSIKIRDSTKPGGEGGAPIEQAELSLTNGDLSVPEVLSDKERHDVDAVIKSRHALIKNVSVSIRGSGLISPRSDAHSQVSIDNPQPQPTNTIVTGPAACGKSSLSRVLAGLWPTNGTVVTPPIGRGGVFIIPQGNFLTEGSLRDNIIYPHHNSHANDDKLISIINEVGLSYILDRFKLESCAEWQDVLSGGECQRLSIARVLYHIPQIAVLDEATSALDIPLEERCMKALMKRGITLLSIATRPTLNKFHAQHLHFHPETQSATFTVPGAALGAVESAPAPASAVAAAPAAQPTVAQLPN